MAAEDPEAVGGLARSFQRIARSLRQTLALKARLKRERTREARENPPPAPPRDEARIQARLDEVRAAVQRVIWHEQEGERADYLHDLLDERLPRLARDNAIGHRPLDDDIAAICADFGLTTRGAAAWRDLPDPEFADDAEDDLENGPKDGPKDDPGDRDEGDDDPNRPPPAESDWRSSA
jgi:hypothetical protein